MEVPKPRNTMTQEYSVTRDPHNDPIITPVSNVWDQRRGEAAVNHNVSNNVELAPDVISALCKTIEGLKNVILEMQSQIVNICSGREIN